MTYLADVKTVVQKILSEAGVSLDEDLLNTTCKLLDQTQNSILLEGNRQSWTACAIFTTISNTRALNEEKTECQCSLSAVLEACKISVTEFFEKLNRWAEIIQAKPRLSEHINRVQSTLGIATTLYRRCRQIFRQVFALEILSNGALLVVDGNICTFNSDELFGFIWTALIALRKISASDLLTSIWVLLRVFEVLIKNLITAHATDFFNSEFVNAIEERLGENKFLLALCTLFGKIIGESREYLFMEVKRFQIYSFSPILKDVSSENRSAPGCSYNDMLLQFDIIRQSFDLLYEKHMLNSLEIDERIFIRPSRLQENSLANSPYDEELDDAITEVFRGDMPNTELLICRNAQKCLEQLKPDNHAFVDSASTEIEIRQQISLPKNEGLFLL
ncbi:retinoblastoma-like protein like protein lin-35 [Ditylenchus destructor]|uniref:Retinoblastoma-like protein like protein lin-35 n=1 Tax=Ditylenchus destructor TaxID=166010 RepID=A0AAD4N8Q8_9BILA|nr:retinoblastoma-like protein like protein lin-35 [Ditylenchus destructor]